MPLLFLFIVIPMVEIALFIQVGGAIGLGWTLAIVLITAILGAWMVRSQGMQAMQNLRGSLSSLQDPTETLAHGAMILFSGALLLTPGFFTDAVGFALLVPGIRTAVYRYARTRIHVQSFDMGTGSRQTQHDEHVIDGDFHEINGEHRRQNSPSGWTKD